MNDTPLQDAPPPSLPGPPQYPLPPPSVDPVEALNPWFSIWVQPRATMRQILATDPRRGVHLLVLAAGACGGLQAHLPAPVSGLVPLPAVTVIKVTFGALGALLFLYLFGLLLMLTGRWLGGGGNFVDVRAALAWSMIPNIWSALLLLPMLIYMGVGALNFDPVETLEEPGASVVLLPLMLLTLIIGVWSIVITIKCVAEAHRFSAWHGLGAALLGVVLVAVPLVLIAGLILVVALGTLGLSPG